MPRSSLLLLVEAFCGPVVAPALRHRLDQGYRFLSFGDAMVVGRPDADHGRVGWMSSGAECAPGVDGSGARYGTVSQA